MKPLNPETLMGLAEEVLSKLTDTQRRVVMSLPADGGFGRADGARCARRMWWGIQKGKEVRLIEHRHMTDNCWCLNSLGQQVRALAMKEGSAGS